MAAVNSFKKKAIVFLLKFFALYAVMQFLILVAPLGFLQEFIAATEATMLGLEAKGSTILFNDHRFEIVANCTGLMSISVLAAIVFSLKKPELKKKIGLLAAGAAILFPLNLLRVYFVLLAATTNPNIAESLHMLTWFAMSAAILILWYCLTKRVAKVKRFGKLL